MHSARCKDSTARCQCPAPGRRAGLWYIPGMSHWSPQSTSPRRGYPTKPLPWSAQLTWVSGSKQLLLEDEIWDRENSKLHYSFSPKEFVRVPQRLTGGGTNLSHRGGLDKGVTLLGGRC